MPCSRVGRPRSSLISRTRSLSTTLIFCIPDDAKVVNDFIAARILPEPLNPSFVKALRDAFSGLVRVRASLKELDDELLGDQGAVTVR